MLTIHPELLHKDAFLTFFFDRIANLARSTYCFVKDFIERQNRFGNQMYFFQMKNELNFTQSRQKINYYELTMKEMN